MALVSEAARHWLYPALIAGGLSVLAGYMRNDKDLTTRVTALEAHRTDDAARLDRIETKLDRLVGWAFGSK